MKTEPKSGAEYRKLAHHYAQKALNADMFEIQTTVAGWWTAAQVYSNLALSKSQEDNIKALAEMAEGFHAGDTGAPNSPEGYPDKGPAENGPEIAVQRNEEEK